MSLPASTELGIMLAIRLIPPALMTEFRAEAALRATRPSSRGGLIFILALWAAALIFLVLWLLPDT